MSSMTCCSYRVSLQELVTLSRKAQMSPTPAKNVSDSAVAPVTGSPVTLLPAATDEHLLQCFLSPQVGSNTCKYCNDLVWGPMAAA